MKTDYFYTKIETSIVVIVKAMPSVLYVKYSTRHEAKMANVGRCEA